MKFRHLVAFSFALPFTTFAQEYKYPDSLVIEDVPPVPQELRQNAARYLEFRSAGFNSWHPLKREMLITTRFAETAQLHRVAMPGGARTQLTFLPEPVGGGSYRPKKGDIIVFGQDVGGGEFFQYYRYDVADGKITLLTDGKSRNTSGIWAKSGGVLYYSSTRRNGADTDIYVQDPLKPDSARLLIEVKGGGWSVQDTSHDDAKLLVGEYVSINESYIYLADAKTGAKELLTPKGGPEKISYGDARFAKDGKTVYVTTDKGSEFQRLVAIDLASKKETVLSPNIEWNVESFALSPDGKLIAFVSNEDGISVLHLLETATAKEVEAPKLPQGIVGGLEFHENGQDLGFNLTYAKSPNDSYSVDLKSGEVTRWTFSETGGLDPTKFIEPELVKITSFDGLPISGFLYKPDPAKFPGKRPLIFNIHGGPEAQFRPGFMARTNYYLNEMGIAVFFPNVRGSDGYGKKFLTLDNDYKREDSVKDIGAFIDWAKASAAIDPARIAVTGGSYGGYMTLASMVHFNDRLRCGIDIVGVSSFTTFLKNTQDYRRDLRRAEYGDERDEKMASFLDSIAPLNNAKKITIPLFVVQGQNDPRVPYTEAEQIVKSVRENSVPVWYMNAKDEGHGFQKKKNVDALFFSTILFFQEFLLGETPKQPAT